MRHAFLKIRPLLVALVLATATGTAWAYDYNGTPVPSLLLRHNRVQIDAQIAAGWRPTSVEYESTVGGLSYFRVAYVQNTGSHAKAVKFLANTTAAMKPTNTSRKYRFIKSRRPRGRSNVRITAKLTFAKSDV